jgi:octaprenyl-diphosphate synthase
MNLQHIIRPIEEELDTFDGYFRQAMRSKVAFVDMIARYIVKQKGKRIRPALVFLTAKTCGAINESSYRGAALVEILHTATLIHDDVVDEADTRRGFPSINAVWKNKIAVLMGDYMLAKGLLLSLDNNDFAFLKIISDSVRRMSEAEILQTAKSRQLDIDEATYLKIISDKTASLMSTCCQIGAASVTGDHDVIDQMKTFGENIGMVFQIRDDLLDYTGRKSITGKPTGLDMKEKKLTLPLIYALTKAPGSQGKTILRIIKKGASRKDLQHVVEFANEFGGIEYTMKKGEYFSSLALDAISRFPDSPSKESLTNVIDFFLSRSK